MASSAKPAIVLVHGAWHKPQHWEPIVKKLEAAGHEVVAPALPSCSAPAVPEALRVDVKVVRDALEQLTSAGKNVVLVAHSYAGLVASEALAEVEEKRIKAGSPSSCGRILHVLYAAAIILERGGSVVGDNLTQMVWDLADGLLYHLEPYNRFYNTNPLPTARRAIGLIGPIALEAFTQTTKYQGWSDYGVPVTYLACEQDRALSFANDTPKFLARLENANLKDYTRKTFDCDHTPWLSREDEFMSLLWDVIDRSSTAPSLA